MDHLVRQEHGHGKCYGSHEPRQDPSVKSKHTNIDQKTPDMSSSSEIHEKLVQVVENLKDSDLIDNAVAEVQSGVRFIYQATSVVGLIAYFQQILFSFLFITQYFPNTAVLLDRLS